VKVGWKICKYIIYLGMEFCRFCDKKIYFNFNRTTYDLDVPQDSIDSVFAFFLDTFQDFKTVSLVFFLKTTPIYSIVNPLIVQRLSHSKSFINYLFQNEFELWNKLLKQIKKSGKL